MSRYIQNFLRFKPLLSELVARDIKIKYRRSALGVLWTLLNPLFMMVILSVVFSNLFKFDVENYSLYLLSGQVIFNFFSDSTSNAMTAILNNAPLIRKVYVPKYLFVISRIISSFINLLASYTALLLVMLATRADLHYTTILVVVPMFLLVGLSLGVGLILAAATVKFRDIMHLYSVFITALMYLTPIIYTMNILPDWVRRIVMINPLTGILIMFRDVMFYNRLLNPVLLIVSVAEVAIFLLVGLRVFYKNQDTFILNI